MLRDLWRKLKLLWIVLRALRTGLSGVFLVGVTAICIAPATAHETNALALGAANDHRLTLIMHRAANMMVTIDSDKFYMAVADQSPDDMSAWQVRIIAERFADGSLQLASDGEITSNVPTVPPTPTDNNTVRSFVPPTPAEGLLAPRSNSAKFVSARSN